MERSVDSCIGVESSQAHSTGKRKKSEKSRSDEIRAYQKLSEIVDIGGKANGMGNVRTIESFWKKLGFYRDKSNIKDKNKHATKSKEKTKKTKSRKKIKTLWVRRKKKN